MNNISVIKATTMKGLDGAITYSLPNENLELEEYINQLEGRFREALSKATKNVEFYVGALPLLSKTAQISLINSIVEEDLLCKEITFAFDEQEPLICPELNKKIDAYLGKHLKPEKIVKLYSLTFHEGYGFEVLKEEREVAETTASYHSKLCSPPKEFKREPTFSETVLEYIKKKGLSEVECYKKAFMDRRNFSKLRSNVAYQPSKMTAIAIVLALELNVKEAKVLLKKAGYALSPCIIGDLIIKYYIEQGEYDIDEINSVLYSYKQKLIGYNS